MADGKTGKLSTTTGTFRSPDKNAIEIYRHQRAAEAIAKYAPMVLPLLKDVLYNHFGDTPGYGVDDNLDVETDEFRVGWRIFGLGAGEAQFNENTPAASQRKTLLAVEIIFGEMGQATGFLVDTRRTHTTVKTGLLGIKQKVSVTLGASRSVPLSEPQLTAALNEIAQTMEK